jgi:hypothetical protein
MTYPVDNLNYLHNQLLVLNLDVSIQIPIVLPAHEDATVADRGLHSYPDLRLCSGVWTQAAFSDPLAQ